MNESITDTLVISGIDALDLRALRKALPEGSLSMPSAKLMPSQHGDLGATAAIVILTGLAIKSLAVWLAKNRGQKRIEIKRLKTRADGTAESIEYSFESSSSGSDAEVLKQLIAGLKIDPSAFS